MNHAIHQKALHQKALHQKALRQKALLRLSWGATALALLVILMGVYTRLVDAGLGCPDWPACYGHWVPRGDTHGIELFKAWVEMAHRYVAALLGGLILVITVWIWHASRHSLGAYPRWHSAALLLLVMLQGAFGMWTVTLRLWPQVVTLHLLGGFLTLGLLFLLSQRLGRLQGNFRPGFRGKGGKVAVAAVALGGVLVVTQVGLGGWTSSNYAALACPDFPACQTRWWPKMDIIGGFDLTSAPGENHLGGARDGEARVAIHWVHRLGALVLAIYWVLVGTWLGRTLPGTRRHCQAVVGLLLLQLTLGVGNVLWQLPLPAALAHTLGAALLWLAALALLLRVRQETDQTESAWKKRGGIDEPRKQSVTGAGNLA